MVVLGVRYTISDDSAIQSAYNSYTSEGTYYNSADVLVVFHQAELYSFVFRHLEKV